MKNIVVYQGSPSELQAIDAKLFSYEKDLKVEIRVYIVDGAEHNTESLTDEMFMTLAEEYGTVYTLEGFQKAVNNQSIYLNVDCIRFIAVPL